MMRNRTNKIIIICSILQIIIGTIGIIAIIFLVATGDKLVPWLPAAILAVLLIIIGILNIRIWMRRH